VPVKTVSIVNGISLWKLSEFRMPLMMNKPEIAFSFCFIKENDVGSYLKLCNENLVSQLTTYKE
jgi:hypothetical protein